MSITFDKTSETLNLNIYNGVWELYEYDADNLEKWMVKQNIPFMKRKIGKSLKRTFTIKVSAENPNTHFFVQSKTKVTNKEKNVVIDEPQDDTAVDGKSMKSVFTIKNGKLFNVDKWVDNGKVRSCSYTFTVDGDVLSVAFDFEGCQVLQKYKKTG